MLPKIEELRVIVKSTNAAIIGISESKLHDFVLEHEIQIDNYNNLWCGRNRHEEVVVCCIRNDLSYNINVIFAFFAWNRESFVWNLVT